MPKAELSKRRLRVSCSSFLKQFAHLSRFCPSLSPLHFTGCRLLVNPSSYFHAYSAFSNPKKKETFLRWSARCIFVISAWAPKGCKDFFKNSRKPSKKKGQEKKSRRKDFFSERPLHKVKPSQCFTKGHIEILSTQNQSSLTAAFHLYFPFLFFIVCYWFPQLSPRHIGYLSLFFLFLLLRFWESSQALFYEVLENKCFSKRSMTLFNHGK